VVTSSAALGDPRNDAVRDARASLSLLNAFDLRCAGSVVVLPMAVQRLVAFVALHDHPQRRTYVAGVLWADVPDERAAASLRSSLWRLNRLGHRLVDVTNTHLRLAPDVDVDVRRALELAHEVLNQTDGGATEPIEAILDGELLPDWYDEWLVFERERLRQLGLQALEELASRQLSSGRLGPALEGVLTVLRREPLRESAQRLLIRIHLAEGNGAEALRQAHLYRRLLRAHVGIEPSEQFDDLLDGRASSGSRSALRSRPQLP